MSTKYLLKLECIVKNNLSAKRYKDELMHELPLDRVPFRDLIIMDKISGDIMLVAKKDVIECNNEKEVLGGW